MSGGMSATNCVPMKLQRIIDNHNQETTAEKTRTVDRLT